MVVTPLLAAIIIGSFWTGVGTTAVLTNSELFDESRSDVVITAEAVDVDDAHIAACEDRYRSYDADTDMYLSFGGEWKRCLL